MAVDMSWGDEVLITQHEPQIGRMSVWPIPGRLWKRSEKIDDIEFENVLIRASGLNGWQVHRLDGTLLETKCFTSIQEAKSFIVSRLDAKKIA